MLFRSGVDVGHQQRAVPDQLVLEDRCQDLDTVALNVSVRSLAWLRVSIVDGDGVVWTRS